MVIRTRVAPSPTGEPHVGTAYIALFNMAFAKSNGGQFLLRIDDTNTVSSTAQSEQKIFDSLRWLGLNWDEGPDLGGPYGPYRQSQRRAIYNKYAQKLLEKDHAFRCFCSSERLHALRAKQIAHKEALGYDGYCLYLSKKDIQQRICAGEPYVVRMKIPAKGTCKVEDMLRGIIKIDWSLVDMQVLIKADGMPTYHLANVVDDHLMEISHVIRGEEWINSAPKHQLLYQYFGWNMPVLCHMPLLRNTDKSKLSKRTNPTSITYYRDVGCMPEALLNYLGHMGWSMPDEQEKFSLTTMIEQFDIRNVSLGGPIFDQERLFCLNARWIREYLTVEQFAERLQSWLLNSDYIMKFLPFTQERIKTFSNFVPMVSFMFAGILDLSKQDFAYKKLEPVVIKKVLQFTLWRLESLREWTKENIFAEIKRLAKEMDLQLNDFNHPIFIAITGTPNSWSVMDSIAIIKADITRARLRHAINVIGGLSKKEIKRFEKEFKALGTKDCYVNNIGI